MGPTLGLVHGLEQPPDPGPDWDLKEEELVVASVAKTGFAKLYNDMTC